MVIDDREKSYKILAEIYNEENELIKYIVVNANGRVMEVKKEVLKNWS